MQEAGPSPFDEPPTTELTTNTELSGTPSPISGFVSPEVLGREKSQMPQVFGILAVILAVAGVISDGFTIARLPAAKIDARG